MIQIFINGEELELEDLDFGINFQSNNIGDISTRNASYSNTVKVPKTPNNLRILGFISMVGNTSTAPYTVLDTRVVSDGVEIITNGTSYVDSSDGDISLTIYDGIRVIADILGDKTLNDLDWSALNHNLTYSSLQASWLNTSGYTYSVDTSTRPSMVTPYADYMNSLVPCVFWKNIWDMIFAQNGIGYSCDFFTSTDITKLLVMAETGGVVVNDSEIDKGSITAIGLVGPVDTTVLGYHEFTLGSLSISIQDDYRIDIPPIRSSFKNGAGGFNNTKHTIFIYLDTDLIYSQIHNNGLSPTLMYSDYSTSEQFRFFSDAGRNLTFKLRVYGSDSSAFIEYGADMSTYPSTFWKTPKHIPIDFSTIMSETKQLDFIKDGMLMFGLMSSQDKSQSLFFKFKRIEDVLLSKSTAIDWSDKVASQEFKEDYSSDFNDLNAKHNLFKYQYEDEKQSPFTEYNGDLLIDNINLSETRDFYNSIYKITAGYPGRANAFDNSFVPQPSGLKLGYVVGFPHLSDKIKWNGIEYGGLALTTSNYFYYTDNSLILDIHGNSFLSKHYAKLNLLLNKFKRVTMKMKLTSIDIQNLDYTRLKFIQDTSKYYYLNKIKNFKAGQITDVEFIELPA